MSRKLFGRRCEVQTAFDSPVRDMQNTLKTVTFSFKFYNCAGDGREFTDEKFHKVQTRKQ